MPIIINEVEVSVEVSSGTGNDGAGGRIAGDEILREKIVSECVEKVMDIIRMKNER